MQWSSQYLPVIFALCFIGTLLGLRGISFRHQFGHSPFCIPRRDDVSAGAFLSRMLVVCLAGIVLLGLAAALVPEWLDRLDPLYHNRGPAMLTAGAILMSIAAVLVWRAQNDMGDAWRVGINPTERTGLVTRGLYQFCRNPIYLGLQIGLCGFIGLVPSYLAVMLLAVASVLFHVQARLEEAHLLAQHGKPYSDYCHRVGRFLPWTGRFADPKAGRDQDRHES